MPKPHAARHVIVGFRDHGPLTQRPDGALLIGGHPIPGLAEVLKPFPGTRARISFPEHAAAAARAPRGRRKRAGDEGAALSHFARFYLRPGQDAQALRDALRRLKKSVRHASTGGRPRPPQPDPGEPVFPLQDQQGYLRKASLGGVGALIAWEEPGGNGRRIRVCDVEWGFHPDHADLPPVRIVFGDPVCREDYRSHGTSVLGLLAAPPLAQGGILGITGICHGAEVCFASVCTHAGDSPTDGGDTENACPALEAAGDALREGDVLLIEMQTPGIVAETGKERFAPAEIDADVRELVREAVDRGLIVIEPAGNSGTDLAALRTLDGLDAPWGAGSAGTGAILVGAGWQPGLADEVPHSRWPDSNYGLRVTCQGWAKGVVTTGGDGSIGLASSESCWGYFDGTSAAGAMVAGVAADVQGLALERHGKVLTPAEMSTLLRSDACGSPQAGEDAGSKRIGPLPALDKMLALAERYWP